MAINEGPNLSLRDFISWLGEVASSIRKGDYKEQRIKEAYEQYLRERREYELNTSSEDDDDESEDLANEEDPFSFPAERTILFLPSVSGVGKDVLGFLSALKYEIREIHTFADAEPFLNIGVRVLLADVSNSDEVDISLQLLKRIRSQYDVNIIVLSPDFIPAIVSVEQELAYFDYFAQPFHPKVLEWKISQGLTGARQVDLLGKFASWLSSYHKSEKLVDELAILISRAIPRCDFAEIIINQNERLKTLAYHPPQALKPGADIVRLDEGVVGYVFQTGKSINIPSIREYKKQGNPVHQSTAGETKSELAVPIAPKEKIGGQRRVLGVINLENHKQEFAFSDRDRRIVESLGQFFFVAYERDRLDNGLKNFIDKTHKATVEQYFPAIVEEIEKLSNAKEVYVIFVNEETGEGIRVYEVSSSGRKDVEPLIRPNGHSHYVIKNKTVVKIGNLDHYDPKTYGDIEISSLAPTNSKASLCLPIETKKNIEEQNIVGVVWLHYDTPQEFNDLEINLLRLCVNQIGVLYTLVQLKQRNESLRSLTSKDIKDQDLQDFCNQAAELAAKKLEAQHSGFYYYDQDQNKLILWGSYNRPSAVDIVLDGPKYPVDWNTQKGLAARLIAFDVPDIRIENYSKWDFGLKGHGQYQGAILGVPVFTDGVPGKGKIGVLYINKPNGHSYSDSEAQQLTEIAKSLSSRIETMLVFGRKIPDILDQELTKEDVMKFFRLVPGEIRKL